LFLHRVSKKKARWSAPVVPISQCKGSSSDWSDAEDGTWFPNISRRCSE